MGNNRPAFFDTLINLKNASKFGAFLQFPIRLSPQTPYSVGRAALVFVSPHVIDPAENIAEFGWNSGGIAVEDAGIYYEQHPPHSDAYVVAWFKSPNVGTKFGIEFLCKGLPGHSFFLQSSKGDSETVMIPGTKEKEDQTLTDELTGVNVTVTFVHDANDDAWRWFRVSSDDHWRFVSLEIVQFPA